MIEYILAKTGCGTVWPPFGDCVKYLRTMEVGVERCRKLIDITKYQQKFRQKVEILSAAASAVSANLIVTFCIFLAESASTDAESATQQLLSAKVAK